MAGSDRGAVVFLHAHPDDEAIFTGGTMVKLAAAGWRVVLVVATGGELGFPVGDGDDDRLRSHRLHETRAAAEILGVSRLEFLGYRDSGMAGHPDNAHAEAFANADPGAVAGVVADVATEERAVALVAYDDHGIYGHPDHVKVWEVGTAAAARASVAVLYQATVDREYLHFVETHLVVEAGGHRRELGLAGTALGVPTVAVTTVVDVRDVLDVKRRAMVAHASQIPETTTSMQLPTEAFAAVYGYEWYVRQGTPGPLESLV